MGSLFDRGRAPRASVRSCEVSKAYDFYVHGAGVARVGLRAASDRWDLSPAAGRADFRVTWAGLEELRGRLIAMGDLDRLRFLLHGHRGAWAVVVDEEESVVVARGDATVVLARVAGVPGVVAGLSPGAHATAESFREARSLLSLGRGR